MKLLCMSLGCDKNLVDTEMMLGLLNRDGYQFTDDENEADVIIVNTCCFIGDAKEESINAILDMARMKEEGRCKALVVAGCLAQRYKEEVLQEIPEVDAILGTASYDQVSTVLKQALAGKGKVTCMESLDLPPQVAEERVVTTGGHYGYLKIAEGCDKHCTYCIIPSLRGKYRSVPMEQLLKEAGKLAGKGVKELVLVAQETTLYGMDLYGRKALPELLASLCQVEGLRWIRILYCYPEEITPQLVKTIQREEKICHYLDIPIQHASDGILQRMGRKTDRARIQGIVAWLRQQIPDITLRTTLISGFPGETQKDHEILLDFVNQMKFERLGAFPYSEEEGTPAASFPDQVPQKVKEERRAQVMELQQKISLAHSKAMEGKVIEVMIEGKMADEPAYIGRSYMDAPGVDGLVFVETQEELLTGDFVKVKVTGALEYDLIGVMCDEYTK